MPETATVTKRVTGIGAAAEKTADITGDSAVLLNFTIATATTDQEQTVGFIATAVKLVHIQADGAVTLETNSGGAPAHTFTFPSGGGELYWDNRFPTQVANPFGATAVTSTFWTNNSGATVTVTMKILVNS